MTSGIRLGTPAATTRGFKEEQMTIIGNLIASVIKNKEEAVPYVKAEVKKLCDAFPLYENLDNM